MQTFHSTWQILSGKSANWWCRFNSWTGFHRFLAESSRNKTEHAYMIVIPMIVGRNNTNSETANIYILLQLGKFWFEIPELIIKGHQKMRPFFFVNQQLPFRAVERAGPFVIWDPVTSWSRTWSVTCSMGFQKHPPTPSEKKRDKYGSGSYQMRLWYQLLWFFRKVIDQKMVFKNSLENPKGLPTQTTKPLAASSMAHTFKQFSTFGSRIWLFPHLREWA